MTAARVKKAMKAKMKKTVKMKKKTAKKVRTKTTKLLLRKSLLDQALPPCLRSPWLPTTATRAKKATKATKKSTTLCPVSLQDFILLWRKKRLPW